jgi:hypothetical protein
MALQESFVFRDFVSRDARQRLITRHALIVALGVRVGAFLLLAGVVGIAQMLQ